MQEHEFQADLRVLKLRMCDMMIELKRIIEDASLQLIIVSKVQKSLKRAIYDFIAQFFSIETKMESRQKEVNPVIKALLTEFESIFEELNFSNLK